MIVFDLNTASVPLLTKVSGLNSASAKSIAEYRKKNGDFSSREELKDVPKLGEKAYELGKNIREGSK